MESFRECPKVPQHGVSNFLKFLLEDTHLWIEGKKYSLERFENAYTLSEYEVVIQFRTMTTLKHKFEVPRAEEFVKRIIQRALTLRWKRLDKEIESLLRRR